MKRLAVLSALLLTLTGCASAISDAGPIRPTTDGEYINIETGHEPTLGEWLLAPFQTAKHKREMEELGRQNEARALEYRLALAEERKEKATQDGETERLRIEVEAYPTMVAADAEHAMTLAKAEAYAARAAALTRGIDEVNRRTAAITDIVAAAAIILSAIIPLALVALLARRM